MDRPFLTFNQQIEKLQEEYNLIINNYEFSIEALSSFSYYDLINGYQDIYMENKVYKEGITLELLCATHMFNKNIQGVLFKYATYTENSFKTLLSHVIAHNLDFLTYRNSKLDKKANLIFKDSLVLEKELKLTRHDIWGMVLSTVILLNNDMLANNFLAEFNSFMKSDEAMIDLYCDFANIPHDFEKRINNYIYIF